MIYKITDEQVQILQELAGAALKAYGELQLKRHLEKIQGVFEHALTAEELEKELEAMKKEESK
jgi:Asp-tRNA(Asn)/Glu-tRNA(Gln) amidotransferase C subunit